MNAGPNDWLAKAEGDFASMSWAMQAPSVNHDDVVFHSQQCIEKLMKGILEEREILFEKTHELNVLAHLVQQAQPAWTWEPEDLAAIQPGAVLLRYPGYNATRQDAESAIVACTRLRSSLLPFLSGSR